MNKITLFLIGLLALAFLFFDCEKRRANQIQAKYLEEIAKNAELVIEKEGLVSKLSAATATETDLRNYLHTANQELAKTLKSRNEKLTELNNLKLKFENLQLAFNTISEIDSAGRCITPLDTTLFNLRLFGRTYCDSTGGRVELDTIQLSPIRLQLYKAKAQGGLWRYYVNLSEPNSFVTVDSLEVMFTEPKPSFFKRNSFWLGVGAGAVSVLLLK